VAIGAPAEMIKAATRPSPTRPVVAAGQEAVIAGAGVRVRELSSVESRMRLAWQDGMLIFNGGSLAEVVAEFNRYNRRQLVIEDSRLARLRIGGYFKATNLAALVDVLEHGFGVQVVADGEQLLLKGRVDSAPK